MWETEGEKNVLRENKKLRNSSSHPVVGPVRQIEPDRVPVAVSVDPRVLCVRVLCVPRGHHHHAVSPGRQRRGQRAADVAEPARLGPWGDLGGDEDDVVEPGGFRLGGAAAAVDGGAGRRRGRGDGRGYGGRGRRPRRERGLFLGRGGRGGGGGGRSCGRGRRGLRSREGGASCRAEGEARRHGRELWRRWRGCERGSEGEGRGGMGEILRAKQEEAKEEKKALK